MKKLSRNEMKKVMGGVNAPGDRICGGSCVGSVGEWIYLPQTGTFGGCLRDIATYCSSGSGSCSYCDTGGGEMEI